MKRHLYIYIIICNLLALVPLLTACTSDDNSSGSADAGPVTVSFDATLGYAPAAEGRGATRAANAIDNAVAPDSKIGLDTEGGFGVFACYTGLYKYVDSNVHPDFMYNEHVTYDKSSSSWVYSPIKYWPNGEGETNSTIVTGENPHYVSFMAYAPWTNNLEPDPVSRPVDYCIPSFSKQGDIGNPWLTYRLHDDVMKQVDLLCAVAQLDQKKPSITYRVPFVFNHALACVGDKITIQCSPGLESQIKNRVNPTITKAQVVVTSLKIVYTLTSKARLVLWNRGEANWQTIFSEDPICTRSITFLDADDPTDDKIVHLFDGTVGDNGTATPDPLTIEGKGVYYIPAELVGYVQTAELSVTYHVSTYNGSTWTDDEERTGTATITLHDYKDADLTKDAYRPGKHLYINVKLNPMDIALTAAIADWVTVGPVEVEGIED